MLVQGKIAEYLNRLAQLGVAGVRVDAAKHMNSWDMGSILQVSRYLRILETSAASRRPCGVRIAATGVSYSHALLTKEDSSTVTSVLQQQCGYMRIRWDSLSEREELADVQGVNSSLYVYQEVLEGCNELVTAEEYTSLGQVC